MPKPEWLTRLEAVEGLVAKSAGKSDVERALDQVKENLENLPYTENFVMIRALENLALVTAMAKHEDAGYYRRSLAEAKQYEGKPEFARLVQTLYGGRDDKKFAAAMSAFYKSKRDEEGV